MAGAGLSLFITLAGSVLSLVLAMFAGFFLYIGAGDLLPEAVKVKPRILTTAAMLLGAGVIWLAVQLAG